VILASCQSKLIPTLHPRKFLCGKDTERLREQCCTVKDLLTEAISTKDLTHQVVILLDNLKQGQFELVFPFFSNSQIGKDEKGGIGIIDIFEMVER
jgi:hypothetical protein